MAAHVLRLRFDILLGSLRGDRLPKTVVGFVALAAATFAVCWALLSLRNDSAQVAHVVTVLVGTSLAIGALLGPLVGGIDDQLDPRRFAVFGLDANRLAPSLVLGALVSVPSLAVLAVAVSAAVLWTERGVAAWISWPSALIGFLTVVLLSRVSMALASLFSARRTREMSGLFVLGLVVVVAPVAVFFASLGWRGVVPRQLHELVGFLQTTPFGAAWGVPGATATHGSARWLFVIAVVTLLVVAGAWFLLVRRLLTTTERPDRGRTASGMGWFSLLPGTASGAVAARSLVYWLRDRRYFVNVLIIPIASIVAVVPLLVAGVPAGIVALLPVPFMALFLGWVPHNDIAYDSTAIWLHVVSGVRGIADRVGRLLPIVLIAVPLLAVAIPISIALYGRWAMLPALVGVATSLFLCGLGLSSIASVLAPYPVARPGDSPFAQPQRASSGVGAQALALVGAVVLSLPALILAWRAVTEDVALAGNAMWAGIGTGVAVLAVGLGVGAWLFERRGARIMEFAEAI